MKKQLETVWLYVFTLFGVFGCVMAFLAFDDQSYMDWLISNRGNFALANLLILLIGLLIVNLPEKKYGKRY
jgi:hypothetical protein